MGSGKQISGVDSSSQDVTRNFSRPVANFQPDIWGDLFLPNISDQFEATKIHEEQRIKELKEEIRRQLKSYSDNPMQQLRLIDSIQRLGVAYHFELEIDQALQSIFETFHDHVEDNIDVYSIALSFRLLRQQGYKVSCNIFDKFLDAKGEFKVSIDDDVMGLLEFYEATHLSLHGENILYQGLAFTTKMLQSVLPDLKNDHLAEQIHHALRQPNRRGISRLESRHYISIYEHNSSHNQVLLMLAKLDFNKLQSMHRMELSEIRRWWKGLDFAKKLPFARDRVVEGYFWILGVYFEPEYVLARKILTKVLAITSIIDDIYDAYGTFEELEIFTESIERWSIECLDKLPQYMKFCYQALLDLYEEIEEEMAKQGRLYRIYYAKEAIKILARAYFDEVKWREQMCTPTIEEYMCVATKSCGYTSLIISSFLGMGDIATEEAFQWVLQEHGPVKAASVICRLKDDIVGNEFEKKRKHIPSAVDCYMRDHNASKQEAVNQFNNQIEAAWRELNQGFLVPTKIPVPLLYRILNFARVIEVVYKEDDWYTHVGPQMQSYIKQVLVDPIPI